MLKTNNLRAAKLEVARRNQSQRIDITLDVSAGILKTLKYVAKISPVPFLSNAASIALSIVDVVQNMRNNRHGFKELAKDSCEIVSNIINAHKDVSQSRDVPIDLINDLEQLVNVLLSIKEFARKGASRNFFATMLRSNVDARRIQDYQKKLYQAIHIFGLQSDIILRNTIAQLAADQVMMANQLNSITARVLALPSCVPPSFPIPQDILLGTPQNNTSRLVNSRALPYVENVLSMDNYEVTDRQDKNILMDGPCQIQCSELLSWLHLKDGDRRARYPFSAPLIDIIHDTAIHLLAEVMDLLQIVASWFFGSMRMQSKELSDGPRTAATLRHGCRWANRGLLALGIAYVIC